MSIQIHGIGFVPIKILAGASSCGLPKVIPDTGGGSWRPTASPNEAKVATNSSTKPASVPLTAIPAMRVPRADIDIRLSANGSRAALNARINCSPKAADSTSKAYDEIVMDCPWRRRTATKLSICAGIRRRGAICLSKFKFRAVNSAASLSSRAARSLARAAVAFASSLRTLASAIRWSASFWVASVISYPTQAEINADTTVRAPKTNAAIVAHLNTLVQNGSVKDHIPPSFWALVFAVFCVVIATTGGIWLVLRATKRMKDKNTGIRAQIRPTARQKSAARGAPPLA